MSENVAMQKPTIRTITLGIADQHPLTSASITKAARTLKLASRRYADANYEVQTTRVSTRPLFDDLERA